MSEGMRAAVFEGDGRLTVREVASPGSPGPGQALIRVHAASICGTDLHILEVPPGHPATPGVVLGHEYVGEVVAVGPGVGHVRPGDHVVVDPNIRCGTCRYCQRGLANFCENFSTLGIFQDGGFAPYNLAPAANLYPISPEVPWEYAVFAEILSCVVNGTQKVALHPGETAVVLGAGPAGLLFTQVLRAAGAGAVIVSEPSPFRADFAWRSGASLVVDPSRGSPGEAVREWTGGLGADVVVDAVGSLLGQALELVRPRGRVLLFGMNREALPPIRQNTITRNEVRILGTYIADRTFPAAIRMIERGLLNLDELVTHRLGLEEIPEGIEALRSGRAVKVIIDPQIDRRAGGGRP